MATCSNCAIDVTAHILRLVKNKLLVLPDEIHLSQISRETGYTPQLIGMAFDDYISIKLKANGIEARKAGSPTRLQLVIAT